MDRKSITTSEGDRLWPLMEMISNTWIDDLTEERIQELVAMVDSWRITDADGKLIGRKSATITKEEFVRSHERRDEEMMFLAERVCILRERLRAIEAPLRAWLEMQSRENAHALYAACLKHFNVDPAMPD
jgi:hypothetical protein